MIAAVEPMRAVGSAADVQRMAHSPSVLGRVLISGKPNADLDASPDVRY